MTQSKYLQAGFDKQLSHLMEECSELILAGCKIQRWGRHSWNPDLPPYKRTSNLRDLIREMQDIKLTMNRLEETIKSNYPQESDIDYLMP